MPRACAAINCKNKSADGKGLSFFKFPTDDNRRREWLRCIGRNDLNNDKTKEKLLKGGYVVCEQHFGDSMVFHTGVRKQLKHNAVPTIVQTYRMVKYKELRKITPKPQMETTAAAPSSVRTGEESTAPTGFHNYCAIEVKGGQVETRQYEVQYEVPSLIACQLEQKEERIKQLERSMKQEQCKRRSQKFRMLKKIKALNEKLQVSEQRTSEDHTLEVMKLLPPLAQEFIRMQLLNAGKEKHGMRFSIPMKELSLQVHHLSPKCYLHLRKLFSLPCPITLNKYLVSCIGHIQPGFLDGILRQMRRVSQSMSPQQKVCVLVFDEMALRDHQDKSDKKASKNDKKASRKAEGADGLASDGQPARHAMVFMARGVAAAWKQTIGYFFSGAPISGERIASLLKEAVHRLEEIGLTVRCVICDQAITNMNALKILGASLDPKDPIDSAHCLDVGKKIPVIFDVPQLVKSVRNNMKKYGLQVGGHQILWRHLEMFYDIDKTNSVKMAPKLTDQHMHLPPFSNMHVRYATQVFSQTVSAGMQTLVEQRALPMEAKHTALFLDKMDKLFDILNSRNPHDLKCWRQPLSKDSTTQLQYLIESIDWVRSWHLRSGKTPPCQRGLELTLRSVRVVHRDLLEAGVKYLRTSKLNQECVKNLFSAIKRQSIDHPSAREFTSALKSALMTNMMQCFKTTNCQPEDARQPPTNCHGRPQGSTSTEIAINPADAPGLMDIS